MKAGREIYWTHARFMAAAASCFLSASPAWAQYYYSAPDLRTAPVTGTEPELGLNLPGATPNELHAALIWHLRVAMNVAALQCDFEPSLLTVSNYNATLAHHKVELADAFATLHRYFARARGNAKAGASAFDQYNTQIYSSYSTVRAQRDFCNVMGKVGRDAIFADRGMLYKVARQHLGEIRLALVPRGDQYFTNPAYGFHATLPLLSENCWKKDQLTAACKASWEKYAVGKAR